MDDIDRAQEREQDHRDEAIKAAAKPLEPGIKGICDLCGEENKRLVFREGHGDVCARCRDSHRLP